MQVLQEQISVHAVVPILLPVTSTGLQEAVDYDVNGNLINRSGAATSADYGYDLLDRLAQEVRADDSLANGNRLSKTGM